MPIGSFDFTLTVDGSGEATSPYQYTNRIHSFAIKCDTAFVWEFDIVDKDGFPVFTSDETTGPITGPRSIPVDRRCAGFFLKLKRATAGTYVVRASVD